MPFLVKIGPKTTNDDDNVMICLDFPWHFDKCVSSVDVETSTYVLIVGICITNGCGAQQWFCLFITPKNLLFFSFCWHIAWPHKSRNHIEI